VKPADAKLQRWIDLIAALLRAHYGETLEDLKTLVPGYGRAKDATVARMFERDKDELRSLGIPIEATEEETDEGTTARYRVRASEMYLPYLTLVSAHGQSKAIPPAGYRTVPSLAFEPDELSALLRAAHRVRSIGEPTLTHDAESAIRKLTYDLALGAVAGESDDHATHATDGTAAARVGTLGEALLRRKQVSFDYYSINRDVTDSRTVDPYGLFFTGGHWYLAARDAQAGDVRSFRVSRMKNVSVNEKRPQSTDYEIPPDFSLARHARAKEPWEIGDDAPVEMIVEFRGESGATVAARSLGADVTGQPLRRRFTVRRTDSFIRWMMSFAGEVIPVSPEELVTQYRSTVAATLAIYSA
jgi:proteasome accessory factor B